MHLTIKYLLLKFCGLALAMIIDFTLFTALTRNAECFVILLEKGRPYSKIADVHGLPADASHHLCLLQISWRLLFLMLTQKINVIKV